MNFGRDKQNSKDFCNAFLILDSLSLFFLEKMIWIWDEKRQKRKQDTLNIKKFEKNVKGQCSIIVTTGNQKTKFQTSNYVLSKRISSLHESMFDLELELRVVIWLKSDKKNEGDVATLAKVRTSFCDSGSFMLSNILKMILKRSRHQCGSNVSPYVFIISNITVRPLQAVAN